MEKLIFKTIETQNETNLFLDKVENYSGVRLPLDYANNSKIVGVFSHEKLVAGYMMVTKPGFRSLMFVPDAIKKSHQFFLNDEYEMMEVNGLWIGPSVKKPQLQFRIWLNLAKDIQLARKKYLLLMSNSKNRNIEYLHSLTNPEMLYEGPPNIMVGDDTHSDIRVAFTTRWNCLLCIPKYWFVVNINRQRRARVIAKRRLLAQA
jgi:hypothetical protein